MDHEAIGAALAALRERGFAELPPIANVAATRAHVLHAPRYVDAHIPQTARNRGEPEPVGIGDPRFFTTECFCVPLREAILAPHLFERAVEVSNIAAAYLERDPPVAYSTNAFFTRAGKGEHRPDIQDFHRDQDDDRFLAMFVYLTDVVAWEHGPHEITGPAGTFTIYGPAGTCFLADTSHLHRGVKPAIGERGIAWWRWGVSPRPPANVWDGNEPIPAADLGARWQVVRGDPWVRETFKLLVAE